MAGLQLMILASQVILSLLLFVLILYFHRRGDVQHVAIREELEAVRRTLSKLLAESETGYYDLLQSVESVEKGVKKTAGLVLGRPARDEQEPAPPMSVLDKKHMAVVLQQQGLSIEEISRRLDIPQGELTLMLRLSQRGEGAEAP